MPAEMYFDSFHALLTMDGHGIYVWSVYLIATIVLAVLFIQPLFRRRQLMQQLRDQSRRQSAAKSTHTSIPAAETN
jgi:heme exporter protein D